MHRDVDAHEVGQRLLGHGSSARHGEVTAVETQRLPNLLEENDIGYGPAEWGSRSTGGGERGGEGGGERGGEGEGNVFESTLRLLWSNTVH